jgi:hypothetical protein
MEGMRPRDLIQRSVAAGIITDGFAQEWMLLPIIYPDTSTALWDYCQKLHSKAVQGQLTGHKLVPIRLYFHSIVLVRHVWNELAHIWGELGDHV